MVCFLNRQTPRENSLQIDDEALLLLEERLELFRAKDLHSIWEAFQTNAKTTVDFTSTHITPSSQQRPQHEPGAWRSCSGSVSWRREQGPR